MDDLFLVGRLIFGGYFVWSGSNHIMNNAMYVQNTAPKGVPTPELAVHGTAALLIIGGLSSILGLMPRIGLACIGVFLIGVTPLMHNFWAVPADQRMVELGNFTKNLALLGATAMLAIVPRPWPYSVETRRRTATHT